jgi:hypothetical protein
LHRVWFPKYPTRAQQAPDISPDGKRIVTNPRTHQLLEMDMENGKQAPLIFTQDGSQPAVARSGGRLGYTRSFENVI